MNISKDTSFYQSPEWLATRQKIITDRLVNGEVICEYCHKSIYKKYDIILHHKIELNETNYLDTSISLNADNIMIVHHKCHNLIHNNFDKKQNKIYIVYGAPLSGKSTFVNKNKQYGDLIIDIDRIWECISGVHHLDGKPNGLKKNVFAIRDLLYEQVKHRVGFYNNCYIIGGFALISERERLASELNAELVYIDTTESECLERINTIENEQIKKNYEKYIREWFERYDRGTPHS